MSAVSLRNRMLISASLTLLLIGGSAWGAYQVAAGTLRRSIDADITAVADAAVSGTPGRLPGSPPPAPGTTAPTGRLNVTLTAPDRTVVSGPASVGGVALGELTPGWHNAGGWRVLVRERPRGGSVVVSAETSTTDQALRLTLYALAGSAVAAAASVTGTLGWVWRRGIRPLSRIAATAQRVADGSRSERVETLSLSAEAAALAATVNHLIESQERARADWETARAHQSRFLLDAGHELRTPLTVIRGWADLLARGRVSDVDMGMAHDRLADEAARMSRLIDQLLAVARAEHAPATDGPVLSILGPLCQAVAADHRMLDPTRPLELVTDPAAAAPADQDTVTQIVTNLLANLRIHTPEGTAARLSVRGGASGAELVYEDDGPGVDNPGQIFGRFWQADPSRAQHGAGLGMALVAALVARAGGTIAAARSGTGGLRVTVTFPPL